ncbi:MAG: arginase [Vicinamibacteria bacterium]
MDKVRIIGVRMDLGAGRRGVDMGPSAMRKAGIRQRLRDLEYEVVDDGNLNSDEPDSLEIEDQQLKYLPQIAAVMEDLARRVSRSLAEEEIPLVLGGDHSIAIGTIGGLAGYYRGQGKKVGMIWLDAHGDSNTPETSPSGNIHGMPQAVAFGRGADELVRIGGFEPGESKLDPASCSIIGARSIDVREKDVLADIGLRIFTMEEIDRRGIYDVSREAIDIANRSTEGIHVSFDVDVIDPTVAPGVGTPVMGGLTYRETHTVMEMIAESGRMVAMEVAEVNPILDVRNSTAEVAVEMVASAFGKRIL